MAQDSSDDYIDWSSDDYIDWSTDDDLEMDYYQLYSSSSPATTCSSSSTETAPDFVQMGFSYEKFVTLVEMGFSVENIARAVEENGPNAGTFEIIDAISKYTNVCEACSSKSKTIDHFLGMGFDEEKVIKAIHEHGEENMEQILNSLLSGVGADSSDDESDYSILLISDDENDPDSSLGIDYRLRSLMKMGFSKMDASLALERCGENVSIDELTEFIIAAQMAREFQEFYTDPEEPKPRHNVKKRRIELKRKPRHDVKKKQIELKRKPRHDVKKKQIELKRKPRHDVKKKQTELKRKPRPSTDDEPIRLPNPMIGFGLPNEPGLITQRSLPKIGQGPPYFYYENVACAPKGVWDTISRHLYDIVPEFVDSKYICAAARKRGYVHNLPISNRFQLQPPPKYTIHEAFPLTKRWWPTWDPRTKLNCILTCTASAKVTNRIRVALEAHTGEPPKHVKRYVIDQCRKWNLVWVGENKTAPLEPDEMENLLGFPRNHTRGGGISRTERLKSLGNSFQVDTVAYHLSVLKPMFPKGINVLSLFTGIGGGEVALHRLQIPMNTVVSVEISEVNRNILKDFLKQTNPKVVLIEFADVQQLTNNKIKKLMEQVGGFDLVIGGSPCNNLAGGNRHSRVGLEGKQSSLFFEYCRILKVVREKTARMRRA